MKSSFWRVSVLKNLIDEVVLRIRFPIEVRGKNYLSIPLRRHNYLDRFEGKVTCGLDRLLKVAKWEALSDKALNI